MQNHILFFVLFYLQRLFLIFLIQKTENLFSKIIKFFYN